MPDTATIEGTIKKVTKKDGEAFGLTLDGHEGYPLDCVAWAGPLRSDGYAHAKLPGSYRWELAHRAAWIIANGPIPKGAVVMHRCDNRACVNAEHLAIGTHADNTRDMWDKSRGKRWQHGMRGEAHPRARLTAADVKAIRESRESLKTLGEQYGITWQYVSIIRRRRAWRSV